MYSDFVPCLSSEQSLAVGIFCLALTSFGMVSSSNFLFFLEIATNKDQALLIEVDPSRASHILYLPGVLKLSLERGWNFVWNSLELNYLERTSGYLEHSFLHKGGHYPSSRFSFLNKLACHWVFQEAGVEYNKLFVEKHLRGKEQSRAALAGRAIRLMQTWHGPPAQRGAMEQRMPVGGGPWQQAWVGPCIPTLLNCCIDVAREEHDTGYPHCSGWPRASPRRVWPGAHAATRLEGAKGWRQSTNHTCGQQGCQEGFQTKEAKTQKQAKWKI